MIKKLVLNSDAVLASYEKIFLFEWNGLRDEEKT